tara:strand:+ start:3214 stop:5310 length:2097 start_codon:yes stop_codon:yes gene_type:complete
MAASVSQINIKFLTKGEGDVAQAFKRLRGETVRLNRDFDTLSKKSIRQVRNEFNRLGSGQRNSINAMQAQRNALNGLRNMADVTGVEFRELTRDIALLDAKMRTAGAGATGFKGRLKGFAKGAGAVAAAGIFGGPEGAVGAGIGALAGGPVGAAVGGAIGAQVGMVRKSLGEVAEYSAALGLQRKALKLVIGDTDKFNKSQEFLRKTSKELAIPQDVITRQFTALTASVVGAGQSVEDAEEVFQAIAAGIRGTGGTLEDMKAAMRATSQVFSKGKVSAEELRQQLGERLPGAFTLFADSMDMTPAMLDKALEQGKVTLDDFMKFAKKLFSTYGENSKILAQGPEAAGDRLKTEMSELKDNVGKLLRPIGAEFQDTFAKIVKSINPAIEALVKFQNRLRITNVEEEIKKLEKIIKRGFKDVGGTMGSGILGGGIPIPVKGDELDLTILKVTKLKQELLDLQGVEKTKGVGLVADPTEYLRSLVTKGEGQLEDDKTPTTTALNNLQEGAKAYFETIKDFSKQTQDAVASAFKGMEDAIVKFVTTGKLNFGDLTRSILADLTRIAIRSAMFNMGKSIFPSFFNFPTDKKNAMGNVYDAGNKISKFAYGGVITKPKLFPMANGIGLMGEAGPEAILPLQRGRGGKLGVIAQGGGTGNITVNVDASGSSAEGDNQISAELGNAIGAAIQAELVNQKRPGGLLA